MRRFAVMCAVVLLLASPAALAASSSGPGGSGSAVDPFRPEPPPPKSAGEHVTAYVGNRVRDLLDIFTLKLGWGTDKSIGVQLRVCRLVQVGAGIFEGYVFAIDRGCLGTMKEAEIEGGISLFYVGNIARKVIWQTKEAKQRNIFFGDVGDKGALTPADLKTYDDENQGWFTSTAQAQLPYLPKIELTIHWGEVFDFPLSIFGLFRVPPKFSKIEGPGGEMIPNPSSIFWHGKEDLDKLVEGEEEGQKE